MAAKNILKLNKASLERVSRGLVSVVNSGASRKTLDAIGTAAIDMIRTRTQSRKSAKSGAFTPYTTRYAKIKGVSKSAVDLTVSGKMLGDMDKRVKGKNTVELFFNSGRSDMLASVHHLGGGVNPERSFFDVGNTRSESITFENIIFESTNAKASQMRSVFQ